MSVLKNWHFKQVETEIWYPCVSIEYPFGNQVHIDLQYNDLIGDPFENDNEIELEWIKEVEWEYKCLFNATTTNCDSYLVFEGLDTFADVKLNDISILNSSNAFQKHIINVTDIIQIENKLYIRFNSSYNQGKQLELNYGKLPNWNGDSSRVYVRKPQYQYGWDWQPSNFNTAGPWKPIKLIQEPYIEDMFIKYELSENMAFANLSIEISGYNLDETYQVRIKRQDFIATFNSTSNYILDDIDLWSPSTPNLYTLEILSNGSVLKSQKVGFRKVELIQNQDLFGQSFYFKINNEPLQIHGVNWIPLHSFTSNTTIENYKSILNLIHNANFNLIRVWGGGQYEIDVFYEYCDQLGILIWQDFMFSCGIYPKEMYSSVDLEVEQQISRFRKYASIIIYTGNNEDYQIANSLKIDTNNVTQFPGKKIYEEIIPTKIKNLSNQVIYHFGSPYSAENVSTYYESVGDTHQWKVWLNEMEPYQKWMELSARFVSEFGMFSLPRDKTLSKYITKESELYPYSKLVNFRSKADKYEERLNHYLNYNFGFISTELSEFIYYSQLLQSDALALAFRYWRFKWMDYQVGGIIVWQLNDCWPGLSWSIIDFEGRLKLAYYGIKRELKNEVVGLYRSGGAGNGRQTILKFDSITVWGIGDADLLKIDYYTSNGDFFDNEMFNVNSTRDISIILQDHLVYHENLIIQLRTFNASKLVARSSDWPLSKYINIDPNLCIDYLHDGKFKLSTNKPVKGLELYFDNDYLFSDNGIDLFPNDPQIIQVYNFNQSDIKNVKYRFYKSLLSIKY
ncbi:unnamed protein product [Candida verbasci]|uniref:beta-mannosidase n=1 Tax=Candida verbasci TaxID=1227364 RepID=A0A9W4TP34_9ASCO|nr:unnamed protein product [Candida verbasci]